MRCASHGWHGANPHKILVCFFFILPSLLCWHLVFLHVSVFFSSFVHDAMGKLPFGMQQIRVKHYVDRDMFMHIWIFILLVGICLCILDSLTLSISYLNKGKKKAPTISISHILNRQTLDIMFVKTQT